jgi:hypothetical protein
VLSVAPALAVALAVAEALEALPMLRQQAQAMVFTCFKKEATAEGQE